MRESQRKSICRWLCARPLKEVAREFLGVFAVAVAGVCPFEARWVYSESMGPVRSQDGQKVPKLTLVEALHWRVMSEGKVPLPSNYT